MMTAFLKKIFFYLIFTLLISSSSYSAEPNAEAFVLKLTNEAKLIFNDKSLNVESRLKKLNDLSQSYLVLDSKKINENNIIVSTKIFSKKDAQEINVDWRIYTKDSKFLARDLVVEGLSLARTQKEEFASIIASKGFVGVISALENFNKSN